MTAEHFPKRLETTLLEALSYHPKKYYFRQSSAGMLHAMGLMEPYDAAEALKRRPHYKLTQKGLDMARAIKMVRMVGL